MAASRRLPHIPYTLDDPPSFTKFTWKIEEFSRSASRTSEVFYVDGYSWRVVVDPIGAEDMSYSAIYLDIVGDKRCRWGRFKFSVVDHRSGTNTVSKGKEQFFNGRENLIGFPIFMSFDDIIEGYLVEDTCVIEVEISVIKLGDVLYDSKRETGFTLYHIPLFRNTVFNLPTAKNGDMPLALKRLFCNFQFGRISAEAKELAESFGWESSESLKQYDVQELNRTLCEKLENTMKGSIVEGRIQELFRGNRMNSSRKESFYDIHLDVKGCRDVYASFDKYVEIEKGTLFVDFPPLLLLINDGYEFPLTLDLDREDRRYLSPDSDESVQNLYTLHNVLVHRGEGSGGHCYAFIRPTLSDAWFKFDDERVTKEYSKMAVEENFGGEDPRNSCAYMLVYVRESDKDKIMCDVKEEDSDVYEEDMWNSDVDEEDRWNNDVAETHLLYTLKKEREKQERMEEAEAYLYTTIKVARDQDIVEQIGRGMSFDLFNYRNVATLRVKKDMSFKKFQEEVAQRFGVPVELQRFWWEKVWGQNYRRFRHVTPSEELSVGDLDKQKLFLETDPGLSSLAENREDGNLLFFKLYDPKTEQVRYVGRLFVKDSARPTDVLPKLNEMAGFAADVDIDLYVELKSESGRFSCARIDKNKSFCHGHIIWIQRSLVAGQYEHPDVPSFIESRCDNLIVHFRSLEKKDILGFALQMSLASSYDLVVEKVAAKLGVEDPTKIRLTSPSDPFQEPSSSPIGYRAHNQLSDMFLWTFEVIFHPYYLSDRRYTIHRIRVPKNNEVRDVLEELKTKVDLSLPFPELRLLQIRDDRLIDEIFEDTDNIDDILENQYGEVMLRADEIPAEEKDLGDNQYLLRVHYFDDADGSFVLVLRLGETLAAVKMRIRERLNIGHEEFSKWKFRCCFYNNSRSLTDYDVVSSTFHDMVKTCVVYEKSPVDGYSNLICRRMMWTYLQWGRMVGVDVEERRYYAEEEELYLKMVGA
ncbi:ubiquitinyl hydrolase 1 [Ranunculus cassubicifolius]